MVFANACGPKRRDRNPREEGLATVVARMLDVRRLACAYTFHPIVIRHHITPLMIRVSS